MGRYAKRITVWNEQDDPKEVYLELNDGGEVINLINRNTGKCVLGVEKDELLDAIDDLGDLE